MSKTRFRLMFGMRKVRCVGYIRRRQPRYVAPKLRALRRRARQKRLRA